MYWWKKSANTFLLFEKYEYNINIRLLKGCEMSNLIGLSGLAITGIIIAGLLLFLVLYIVVVYNSLIKKRNSVEEGFSTMDVYMKKRYDLVPNLVETVKGYAKHEKSTLEKVVELRNIALTAKSIDEKVHAENQLTTALKNIFALAENYPQLKADANFVNLQNQLMSIENDIANSRKYYNAVVKNFNNSIQVFPSNIVARMCKFEKFNMFVIKDEDERKNVQVKF